MKRCPVLLQLGILPLLSASMNDPPFCDFPIFYACFFQMSILTVGDLQGKIFWGGLHTVLYNERNTKILQFAKEIGL